MADKIEISPIGYFRSSQVHPYEAGRQPDEHHAEGVIELLPGQQFEQALIGIELCPMIWVIFQFHHNPHWNPMVLPPRGRDTKIGVFATRSPYRPNGIGMSCVEIRSISKLSITVTGADILDGSPILDIKPYVAYADSFPGVEPAWLAEAQKFAVSFTPDAEKKLQHLENQELTQLRSFLLHQLEYEPTNGKKKRVKADGNEFVIAYRTWRARFEVNDRALVVLDIFSGYSEEDLQAKEDPYHDKNLHREFKKLFPPSR
ncbi:tRNA (N6-threonylcarbamoyladenosine(37)-N6)-methyltransferase TrmO [Bdellovibrio sp. HCB2-146]|uniref:tRNA (N6-threonylcarbamoyladenosine(37)-N6)-methyltransferase TrmO n=1 Tax=Bdellovibrio sp. HCB2-146 TaxID=3394362 RepID=UPI0039BD3CB1